MLNFSHEHTLIFCFDNAGGIVVDICQTWASNWQPKRIGMAEIQA